MNGENPNSRWGLIILSFSILAGLIISSLLFTGTLEKIKSDSFLTVKGYAEKNIKSDLGIWWGTISARSSDLVSAYTKLQRDTDKFLAFLEINGIQQNKISVKSVMTLKEYRMTANGARTNEIENYVLEQSIGISSGNVRLVEKIANESTSLIKDGVEIYSQLPQYFYTKINDLKIQMLGEATRDARLRAEQLAKNSGSSVGGLKSASQGVFQITPVNSTDVSDMGTYDLSTIDKSIKAVVTIDFYVK